MTLFRDTPPWSAPSATVGGFSPDAGAGLSPDFGFELARSAVRATAVFASERGAAAGAGLAGVLSAAAGVRAGRGSPRRDPDLRGASRAARRESRRAASAG